MSASAANPERRTVLVVDGEEGELDSLDATLSARGYEVVRAHDGAEALEAFRCWRPDLVVTDIPLAHLDGYQLCRELKRDPAGRDVPLIFYSAAFADPEDQAFALGLGAQKFLRKPSEPATLARAAAEALEQRPETGASSLERDQRLASQLEEKGKQLDEVNRRLGREVEQRREAQERVYRLAYFDPLTGLPNRSQLLDRLERSVAEHVRAGVGCALLLLDLDDFRRVQCTVGRRNAELLLRQMAARLERVVAGSDHLLAHLGADEFAVFLHDVAGSDPGGIAHRLVDSCDAAFDLDGLAVDVTASAGIALCPDHARDASSLLRQAETALHHAKSARGGVAFYTRESDPYDPQRLMLVSSLRQGVRSGELVLFYQPKVDLTRGVAVEVEALVRWAHPQLGLLEPAAFIGLAEKTGQIRGLTAALLAEVVRQGAAWQAAGLDLRVGLNLSARNLLDGHLPEAVAEAAAGAGLDGRCLTLEITESALVQEPARARAILERVAAHGVRVAIDDFGTGYSSLSHLKHLPVSELKIDKSFVIGMVNDADDGVIVRSTIDLAHNLGLEVTAEGVESPAVWESLLALRCDLAQGFLLGRPMPAADLDRWMRESPWGRGRDPSGC
jgi:diguanylate cyclase (GGDEF)-like protein